MGRRKKTTEEFIAEAKIKHGELYNYDNVKYVNNCTKVSITCPLHGEFLQTPAHHLRGQGCLSCSCTKPYDTASFKQKLNELYNGDIFLCDGQDINGVRMKYQFKHVLCGLVWISKAGSLLHDGSGCPHCAGNFSLTFESLSNRLKETHNNSVSLCDGQEINGSRGKYRFRHDCGFEWTTTANSVLNGTSCPRCAVTGFNPYKKATFYILSINGEYSFTGFGISNKYRKRKIQHKKNLRSNNCSIQSEILIESDGIIIQELERYIKQTLNCNNSNIDGFKTESVLISTIELKDFAISYLDKMGYNYKLIV